jgi:hypothetical protein
MPELPRGAKVTHKFGWTGTVVTGNVRQRDGRMYVQPDCDTLAELMRTPPIWADAAMLTETLVKDARFSVTATAIVQALGGTVIHVSDDEPALLLSDGRKLKFSVCAELVDESAGVTIRLTPGMLTVLGVTLEPAEGQVAG